MPAKKKPARKPTKKKPARKRHRLPVRVERARSLSEVHGARGAVRQLGLPHVPPPPVATYTTEQLDAVTVQTLRVGRLRADRWQDAARDTRRTFAQWAPLALDAACDAAGLSPLPKGAR